MNKNTLIRVKKEISKIENNIKETASDLLDSVEVLSLLVDSSLNKEYEKEIEDILVNTDNSTPCWDKEIDEEKKLNKMLNNIDCAEKCKECVAGCSYMEDKDIDKKGIIEEDTPPITNDLKSPYDCFIDCSCDCEDEDSSKEDEDNSELNITSDEDLKTLKNKTRKEYKRGNFLSKQGKNAVVHDVVYNALKNFDLAELIAEGQCFPNAEVMSYDDNSYVIYSGDEKEAYVLAGELIKDYFGEENS